MFMKTIASLLLVFSLTGCMGRNGLVGKTIKLNLEVTENRWGREGLFIVMLPIHIISVVLDNVIFNSIEFWTGENPINGKSGLLDIPKADIKKMGFTEVVSAQFERLDANYAKLHLEFSNGDHAAFNVARDGKDYTVSYLGVELYKGVLDI